MINMNIFFQKYTLNTNLLSEVEKIGTIDFQTNLKIHNYDNKFENFF